MTVRVSAASTLSSSTGTVFVRCNDTSNVLDEAVVPESFSMIVRHLSTTTGNRLVYIEDDSLRSLYPIVEQATIVNIAVLGGPPITDRRSRAP
jgi:hypothetical protein